MADPREAKPKSGRAYLALLIIGAAVGLAFGYLMRGAAGAVGGGNSFGQWLSYRGGDAAMWVIVGAVTVAGTVYAWRSFTR